MFKEFVVIEKFVCFDGSVVEKRVGFFNTKEDAEWVAGFSAQWNEIIGKPTTTFKVMTTLEWADEWGWDMPDETNKYSYFHSHR